MIVSIACAAVTVLAVTVGVANIRNSERRADKSARDAAASARRAAESAAVADVPAARTAPMRQIDPAAARECLIDAATLHQLRTGKSRPGSQPGRDDGHSQEN